MKGPLQKLGHLVRSFTRSVLRATERLLWVTALAGLGVFLVARGDAWVFQTSEAWRTGSRLQGLGAPDPVLGGASSDTPELHIPPRETDLPDESLLPDDPVLPEPVPPPEEGTVLGTLEIPRLGVESVVIAGADETALRRGVGHITGSGLPGSGGTVGLAGHRDGVFRPLERVRRDDVVLVDLPDGRYRYRVVGTAVVQPSDTWVLDPPRDDTIERLTLVTCYPFRFVGPAPRRFIVYAHREDPLP